MKVPRALAIVLWPLSLFYGAYVRRRAWLYAKGWLKQKRLNATVISVGNLTVGGTGKTPMVLWLAEKFLAEGKKVAILSRGYRGSRGTSDEVALLKRRLGGRVEFGREPIAACERADILVVTRKFERPTIEAADAHKFSIFYAQTRLLGFRRFGSEPTERYLSEIGPGPFLAFCGIGNPDAFFTDLVRWHVPVAEKKVFADHYRYSRRELLHLQSSAKICGAAGLVTTEKDAENLASGLSIDLPIWVAVIDFVFTAESELVAAIERKLAARGGVAA